MDEDRILLLLGARSDRNLANTHAGIAKALGIGLATISRMLRDFLRAEGVKIGRCKVTP